MKLDAIILSLGEFGPYQKLIYSLVCLTSLTCSFQTMISVYFLDELPHRCKLPADVYPNDTYEVQNPTHKSLIQEYIPQNGKHQYDSCWIYHVPNDSFGIEVDHNYTKVRCTNGWVYDHKDFINSFVSEFNLVCEKDFWNLAITQAFLVGVLIGSLVMGILSDKIGRKKTLMLGVVLQIVPGIGSAFVSNPYAMCFLRFLSGYSTSSLFPIAFVLSMELVGPAVRTHTGIIIEYVFAVGVMSLAGLAYLIRYWRYLMLAVSIPSCAFLSFWWIIPESPRWLIANNRPWEAKALLEKMSRFNKKPTVIDVEALIEEESVGLLSSENRPSAMRIFHYPAVLFRFVNIAYQWFVCAMLYYGLSYNLGNLHGDVYLNNFLSGLVECAGYVVPHLILNRLGRKYPYVIAMAISGIACALTLVLTLSKPVWLGSGITAFALVGKGFTTMCFGIVYIWSAELFPTVTRNIGIGISSMCGRVGSLLGPVIFTMKDLMNGRLGTSLPLTVFGGFAIIGSLGSILLPESLNRPMPQTMDDIIYSNRTQRHIQGAINFGSSTEEDKND